MLWPHQETGIAAVHAAIYRGVRRILLTAPTGAGKSKIMAHLAEDYLKQTKRVVIYSNRKLLVEQLSQTFTDHNLPHGIRSADYTTDHNMMLQISSVQTEDARVHKSQEWTLHDAQLILVDEAHLSKGPTYQKIFNAHAEANAVQVGFTATPLELETLYDELIVAGTNSELRKCGALVPCLHYGADEPDLRILKKKPADGEDFSENQIKQAMMNPTIYARVIQWFTRLNPDRKPAILFAPGVNESLWFAEQFVKAGIPAGHIASDGVWMNGAWLPTLTPGEEKAAKKQLIEASRTGEITVICNRYMMREGLDLPWLEFGILATILGSLQTYLQVGGRLLRACPSTGKTKAVIIDHGGNYWRHGSLNADRVWALNYTNSTVYAIRAERMREKRMEEPYRCPQCGLVVAQRNCPCGFVCPPRRSRPVVQFDGTLKEHTGDIFKPRRVSKNPNGPKIWEKMYHRSRTEKGQRTFRAAAALFARENNFQWPDKNWPFMPVDELDWFRLVSDIPRDRLTGGYA